MKPINYFNLYTVTKIILILIVIISFHPKSFSQGLGVNATGAPADPSAMLDVSSTDAGILIPRMTEVQKNLIASPATGLMIYQTDGSLGFWHFNGTNWVQSIGTQGATGPTGPTGASSSCQPAQSGETLINFMGCLYVKNVDESGAYTWQNAVTKCKSYGGGWYLPGKSELDIMYQHYNQPALNGTCFGGPCPLNGFNETNYYWSSTILNTLSSWAQWFGTGIQQDRPIGNTYYVRCVRR